MGSLAWGDLTATAQVKALAALRQVRRAIKNLHYYGPVGQLFEAELAILEEAEKKITAVIGDWRP